jgi:hypothetical protein
VQQHCSMVQQDGATVGLKELLYHALNEGPVYSALVPWVLDCSAQVILLLQAVDVCLNMRPHHTLVKFSTWQGMLMISAPIGFRRHRRFLSMCSSGRSCSSISCNWALYARKTCAIACS